MAETAENLAEQYKLTRQAVDEVALASQQRAKQAWDACVFQDEVVPVPVKQKGQTVEFRDRKSTRLNSSHGYISYAVFCLKKKKTRKHTASAERRACHHVSVTLCSETPRAY